MKKTLLLTMCIMAFGFAASAQGLKFGHINSQEILHLTPERDSAIVKLQAYEADLTETMQGMQDEFQTKYTEYERKMNEWAPVVREAKEKELQELNNRMMQFQQSAQQEMQQMQQLYFTPIIEAVQKAIEKVAKSNSLSHVIDLAGGSLIYFDDKVSVDLLPLVKKELGIPAEKVAPTQFTQQQQ